MSALYLAANQVLGTGFGHLQLVLDPDNTLDTGDEVEIEVQPTSLFGAAFWDVSPEQPFQVPDAAFTLFSDPLELDGRGVEDVWALLTSARDFFAEREVEYHLGLTGAEGQNSNTYITTLSHIVELDISGAIEGFLSDDGFSSFPGQARNVLFDLVAENGPNALPLALTGTEAGDVIRGGTAADEISGASGNDRLYGARGQDELTGDAGRDKLFGGKGRDDLDGGTGRDRLWGQNGNDILQGDKGNDRLFGQRGADNLEGGLGNDILSGGRGRDVFLFNAFENEGRDTILDFDVERDLLSVELQDIQVSGDTDAVITLNSGTEIALRGVDAAQVTDDIFAFFIID
ncbi:MAG: calcium-binding protein [Arenibacterium sp.]